MKDVDGLVDQFVQLIVTDTAYARSTIPMAELRDVDREGFEVLIGFLGNPEAHAAALEKFASELGTRRAHGGIPEESLVAAIRHDFNILWSALRDPKYGLPAEVLVQHGQRVWEAVETYSMHVHTHYSDARFAAEVSNRELSFQRLAALFAENPPTHADCARIARDLRIPEGSNFQLVAIDRDQLYLATQAVSRHTRNKAFGFEIAHQAVLFWATDAHAGDALSSEETVALGALRVGVAPVARGLAELHKASMTAREVLTDVPLDASGVYTPLDRWRTLAHHRLASSGCDPRSIVLRRLERATPLERERIVSTAKIYLETGSLLETANREYCHRNTVINRIESFAHFTGIDLRHPEGAALGLLALVDAESPALP